MTNFRIKRVCQYAQGLALKLWKNKAIGCACAAFITMLGEISSANVLRVHLAVVEFVNTFLPSAKRSYISE